MRRKTLKAVARTPVLAASVVLATLVGAMPVSVGTLLVGGLLAVGDRDAAAPVAVPHDDVDAPRT